MTAVGLVIATIIAFNIYQKYHSLVGKTLIYSHCSMEYIIMERFSLAESTKGYHAIVELLDVPWQFLNILQGVKVSPMIIFRE